MRVPEHSKLAGAHSMLSVAHSNCWLLYEQPCVPSSVRTNHRHRNCSSSSSRSSTLIFHRSWTSRTIRRRHISCQRKDHHHRTCGLHNCLGHKSPRSIAWPSQRCPLPNVDSSDTSNRSPTHKHNAQLLSKLGGTSAYISITQSTQTTQIYSNATEKVATATKTGESHNDFRSAQELQLQQIGSLRNLANKVPPSPSVSTGDKPTLRYRCQVKGSLPELRGLEGGRRYSGARCGGAVCGNGAQICYPTPRGVGSLLISPFSSPWTASLLRLRSALPASAGADRLAARIAAERPRMLR